MYRFTRLKVDSNPFDHSSLVMETEAVGLKQIISDFEDFLRGCGYIFDGTLEIVEEEESTNVTHIDSPLGNQGV